jgi:hypothetical protein|mmetsp:Transcript_9367/g.20832  ORF Transcript_9367/g.20832 Transcript_9367/m.20832 type:complete len:153 (+) Transcript_9367:919-1377(+)
MLIVGLPIIFSSLFLSITNAEDGFEGSMKAMAPIELSLFHFRVDITLEKTVVFLEVVLFIGGGDGVAVRDGSTTDGVGCAVEDGTDGDDTRLGELILLTTSLGRYDTLSLEEWLQTVMEAVDVDLKLLAKARLLAASEATTADEVVEGTTAS